MQYYVEFYDDFNNRALGTDGTRKLDGRLSMFNLKLQAFDIAKRLKAIRKYHSFKIFKCSDLRDTYGNEQVYITNRIELHYKTSHYLMEEQ